MYSSGIQRRCRPADVGTTARQKVDGRRISPPLTLRAQGGIQVARRPWFAFSSDRDGILDVFVLQATWGSPKRLAHHSADDAVLA
jgi:hypothetical protein